MHGTENCNVTLLSIHQAVNQSYNKSSLPTFTVKCYWNKLEQIEISLAI